MAQEHIDFTVPGGDDVTTALHKAEDNFTDLYGQVASASASASAANNALALLSVYGGRNLLVNGDGRINQRVFAGGNLAANKYGYDRWRTLGAASSFTVGTTTISLNGTICQVVEAPDLANAMVTVSVGNPSGPITVSLQPDGTTSTTATGVIPAGSGIQEVTLAVPSTLTGNVFVVLTTAGNVTFDGPAKRSGIQLEMGSVASPFERRHSALEVALCQRYYEKSYDIGAVPGSNTANGAARGASNAGGVWLLINIGPYKVTKRIVPTIVIYNPVTGATSSGRNINSNTDVPMGGAAQNGTSGFTLNVNNTTVNQYESVIVHWTADAEL